MDDTQASNAPTKAKRVGYWMTEKKLRRLNFDAFEILCRLGYSVTLATAKQSCVCTEI